MPPVSCPTSVKRELRHVSRQDPQPGCHERRATCHERRSMRTAFLRVPQCVLTWDGLWNSRRAMMQKAGFPATR